MKRTVGLPLLSMLLLFLGMASVKAQDGWDTKVTWSYSVQKVDESHAYIVAKAKLIPGWHVFSVNHDPMKADFTGYPTTFKFTANDNYKLIGKTIDGAKAHVHEDDLGTSLYFEETGIFKQKIEVLTDKSFDIKFDYSFQICDEQGCLFPPDQSGSVKVSGFKPAGEKDPEELDLKIDGDFAQDADGIEYVQVDGEWIEVPSGNSPKFYKKYLELGGGNEK